MIPKPLLRNAIWLAFLLVFFGILFGILTGMFNFGTVILLAGIVVVVHWFYGMSSSLPATKEKSRRTLGFSIVVLADLAFISSSVFAVLNSFPGIEWSGGVIILSLVLMITYLIAVAFKSRKKLKVNAGQNQQSKS